MTCMYLLYIYENHYIIVLLYDISSKKAENKQGTQVPTAQILMVCIKICITCLRIGITYSNLS